MVTKKQAAKAAGVGDATFYRMLAANRRELAPQVPAPTPPTFYYLPEELPFIVDTARARARGERSSAGE